MAVCVSKVIHILQYKDFRFVNTRGIMYRYIVTVHVGLDISGMGELLYRKQATVKISVTRQLL